MSRIGRPPKPEPYPQWCFRLPQSLADKWDLIIADPLTGRINPNSRQDFFIPLLSRLWDAACTGQSTIDISDLAAQVHQRLNPPSLESIFDEQP